MVHVAIFQTILQIQMGFTPSIFSFDYQSNVTGGILLRDCYSEVVEAEIVVASNISQNQYKHVSWTLPPYCNNYSAIMDQSLIGNILIRNGWVYEPTTIFLGRPSYYLQFDGHRWMVTNSSSIGAQYYKNPARLQFHFSAIRGWINDPNGLVYHNGWYHLFYQYNPYQAHWANMHWGHALSPDLILWKHLPIAIYPNPELNTRFVGGIFTGSALFKNNHFIAAYTDHLEDKQNTPDIKIERQKLAFSPDSLHFGNPKVAVYRQPTGATKNFRDPKIWFDSSSSTYFMILGSFYSGYPSVLLYSSSNPSGAWRFNGALYQVTSIPAVTVECPDLFPLGGKYVLVFNTFENSPDPTATNATIWAVVGDFNGTRFTPSGTPQRIDFGIHFYAMQTYNGAPNRIGIGWMNSWNDLEPYRDRHNFAGAMALPRQILLSADKTRIGMIPVSQYTNYRSSVAPFFAQNGFQSSPVLISNSSKTLEIKISVSDVAQNWLLSFYAPPNSTSGGVLLTWNPQAQAVALKNRFPGQTRTVSSRKLNVASLNLTVILDSTSIEVFINNGLDCGTMRFAPPSGSLPTILLGFNKGAVPKLAVKAWKLQSIWSSNMNPQSTTASPAATKHQTTPKNAGRTNGPTYIVSLVMLLLCTIAELKYIPHFTV